MHKTGKTTLTTTLIQMSFVVRSKINKGGGDISPLFFATLLTVAMAVPVCFNTEVYAQSGQKFASGGNTLANGEFLGTLNNFPLNIKVNKVLRSSFTTTGFDLYGNLKVTKHATVDSILNTWQAVVKDALTVGTTLSVVGNATFNKNVTVTNGIFKVGYISISSNSITSNIGSISFGAGNLTTTGTISASNITTMQTSINNQQLAIGNLQTAMVNVQTDVDTLENKMNNVQSSLSNQQNSIGNLQLAINNHDSILSNHQSEITGIQNQVSAMQPSQWQNDSSGSGNISYSGGNVGIGTVNPSFPLEVSGSIKVTGASSGNNNNGGTPPISQSIIIDGGIDQITATSGTLSFGSSNLTTAGNFQAAAISTGNLTISDNFSTRTITADTIRTANWGEYVRFDSPVRYREPVYMEKMMTATNMQIDTMTVTNQFTATNSVSSDTLVAVKQLNVNHNLALGSDSGSTESDIASRVSTLRIQSDPAGTYNVVMSADNNTRVGIGTKTPTEKLSVDGSVSVSGDVKIGGTINASGINVNGKTSFDSLSVTGKIRTNRITSIIPGDSLLFMGDSSINYNLIYNRIWGSGSIAKGIALGQFATGVGMRTVAIGTSVRASATHSIVIGSGNGSTLLDNTIGNSLMVGFNTNGNVPTLFVGAADGTLNSTGNVGIGTSIPDEKLEVNGNLRINDRNDLKLRNSHHGLGWYGDRKTSEGLPNKPFLSVNIDGPVLYGWGGGALASTNEDKGAKIVLRWDDNGKVGIGTIPPINSISPYKLFVEGGIATRDVKITALSFADYVFEPDYKMMTLNELEKYLILKKHLPGIPSAKEVEKNEGFEIGSLQIKLLEKLEEQTLYIINLQKQIDELREFVANDKK